jgi:hypothetical protein
VESFISLKSEAIETSMVSSSSFSSKFSGCNLKLCFSWCLQLNKRNTTNLVSNCKKQNLMFERNYTNKGKSDYLYSGGKSPPQPEKKINNYFLVFL